MTKLQGNRPVSITGRSVALRLTSVGLALLVLVAANAPVSAAANHTGYAEGGLATCNDTYIGVKFPLIQPAAVQYGGTPLFGTPTQKVAWRANLDQWDGYRWVRIRDGLWITGNAYTSHDYGLTAPTWTLLNGAPVPQVLGFDRLPLRADGKPVYFKVWYEFYWYPDQYRGSGSAWTWAIGHREDRGGGAFSAAVPDQTLYAWCKYPGRNYLL